MRLIPIGMGLKLGGGRRSNVLLSGSSVLDVRVACISGRAMKTEAELVIPKPKPWPYKEKGYNNWHGWIDSTRKRFNENSKVIFVEGPVACGKTAFAKGLAEDLEMQYFPMVNMDAHYVNYYGYDLRQLDDKLPQRLRSFDFKNFIKTPKDMRATRMQYYLLQYKFSQYVDALSHLMNTGQGIVMDRSWYSDMVFVEAMHACGYMNTPAKDYYYTVRDKIQTEMMRPHLVIYLDTPVSVVESNIKKRGLGEEKALTTKFLEAMEYAYKQQYLKSISEHAELLIYDWSEQGDPEVVVEDIERIDFDRFDIHDPKMEDWRMEQEYDWADKRWLYTNRKIVVMNGFGKATTFDVPEALYSGEEEIILEKVYNSAPGNEYAPGYNTSMGDKVLFKHKDSRNEVVIPKDWNAAATN